MRCNTMQWPTAVLTAAGTALLLTALPGFPVPVYLPMLAAGAAALSAVLTAGKKWAWAVSAGWMLAAAAALLLSRQGLAALLDGLLATWQRVYPRIYPTYASDGSSSAAAVFLSALAVPLGLWSAACVRRRRGAALWIAALPAAALLLLLAPALTAWQLLAAALVLLLLHTVRLGGGTGAVRVWCRVAAVVLVTAAVAAGHIDSRPAALDGLHRQVSDTVQTLRYGDNRDAGLTGGDLTAAGQRQQLEQPMLTVTMSQPGSYYLRGFVGETYDGSRWLPPEGQTLAENADAFYWLHSDGFYGQTQLAAAAQAAAPDTLTGENRISVTNTGASARYLYAPYETLPGSDGTDAEAIGDAALYARGLRGQRTYTLTAANNLVIHYQRIAAGLTAGTAESAAFLSDEAAYNRYVYENDTALPDSLRSYLTEKLGSYVVEDGQRHFDYQKAKQNILFYLTTYAAYSESVAAVPEGVDFVLSFLDGAQAGYDVHYASAAAMMFRYYGIPARYVEGFLITKDEAAALSPGESLTLDGTHGHAWVEYYQDGVGWLPFEVTPSYFSVMEQAETYRDISGLVGHVPQDSDAENLDGDTGEEDDQPSLLSFWLKYRLKLLLLLSVLAVIVLLGLFISWLVMQRRKTARRKAGFLSDDIPRAIRSIYLYMMDVLLAQGLPLRNCPPADYAADMDEDLRQEYLAAAALWEEAKFSGHPMEEQQRRRILALKDEVWARAWRRAGPLQRLHLKYVLFL